MTAIKPRLKQAALGDQSQAVLVKLIWSGTNIFLILILLWVSINQHIAANKPPPAYAIASTGEKTAIGEVKSESDQNAIVQGFVQEIFAEMYTWSASKPPKSTLEANKPEADPGVKVKIKSGQDVAIPTTSFIASLALDLNLAKAYHQQIAEYVSKYRIGPGNQGISAVFAPDQISKPVWKDANTATVNIVGGQLIISPEKTTVINLGFQVEVKAARILTLSDAMKAQPAPDIARWLQRARSSGYQITQITPLGGANK
jgi:hypothetical protein